MKVTSTLVAAATLALLACGPRTPSAPAPEAPSAPEAPPAAQRAEAASAPQRSQALCGEDAPDTASRCACLGGYVHAPTGEGSPPCPQGETQLGRVQQGDARAVCCKGVTP